MYTFRSTTQILANHPALLYCITVQKFLMQKMIQPLAFRFMFNSMHCHLVSTDNMCFDRLVTLTLPWLDGQQ